MKGQKMFAVIKTGGKQYRVAADDVLTIEKLEGKYKLSQNRPGDREAVRDALVREGQGDLARLMEE